MSVWFMINKKFLLPVLIFKWLVFSIKYSFSEACLQLIYRLNSYLYLFFFTGKKSQKPPTSHPSTLFPKSPIYYTKHFILYTFIQISLIFSIQAQTDSIKINRDNIRQRIQLTDYLLSETQEKKDKSLIELGLLNRQIRLRQQLIEYYGEEIKQTEVEIGKLEDLICALEADRIRIIQNYAKTAQVTYQGFSEDNFWLSLLSAENITEAYYRGIYFQQFSRYRKKTNPTHPTDGKASQQ